MANFLDPEEILDQLKLKKDMVAAEFGSGSGGFTIALAKRLTDGLVYALDIQQPPLSALKSRSQIENVWNIRVIRCDLEKPRGSSLSDFSLDLVLVPNVLFQVEDKEAIIQEAERILKKKGRLVVLDWWPKASSGPEQRVSPEEVEKIAKELDLKVKKEFEAGLYHYGLIFEKR